MKTVSLPLRITGAVLCGVLVTAGVGVSAEAAGHGRQASAQSQRFEHRGHHAKRMPPGLARRAAASSTPSTSTPRPSTAAPTRSATTTAPSPRSTTSASTAPSTTVATPTPTAASTSTGNAAASGQSGTCLASWYGDPQLTANGETFDPTALTAANKSLPFNSMVRVTNLANGQSVVVRINDRGPFVDGRCLDLSTAAFAEIADLDTGIVNVTYTVL